MTCLCHPSDQVMPACPIVSVGARKDIRNNEKMLPKDLASKFPECGRFLVDHKGLHLMYRMLILSQTALQFHQVVVVCTLFHLLLLDYSDMCLY